MNRFIEIKIKIKRKVAGSKDNEKNAEVSSLTFPQLFPFLFDVVSAAVFVMRDRFVKKDLFIYFLCLNLYPCVIK